LSCGGNDRPQTHRGINLLRKMGEFGQKGSMQSSRSGRKIQNQKPTESDANVGVGNMEQRAQNVKREEH